LSSEQLREALAEYAHDAWAGWMKYLFSKGRFDTVELEPGLAEQIWVMPSWAITRWARQMETPYADLPESEKESDRQEADRMLALVKAAQEPDLPPHGYFAGTGSLAYVPDATAAGKEEPAG
jgi:hypothetical protein